MNFTTFDGLDLTYETHGDPAAPPVLLIHGLGADHAMWAPQITSFPAAGWFTIVPDLRGHGQSAVPESFTIADCAHDLRDLLDAMKIARAHLVGASMGGMVAQQFVTRYPDRARSQVLVDSLSGVTRTSERIQASLGAILLRLLPPKQVARMITSTYRKMGFGGVGDYFEDRLMHTPPRLVRAARQAVNHFSIIDALPRMRVPTLVLVGDRFGKVAIDMARTTAEGIPGAQFQVLEGGGDPSNMLVPAAFDAVVLAFLRSIQERI